MSGNRTKETASEEPTTSNRYDLQNAECKRSGRTEREVKPLTTGPNLTPTGEVLMDAVAVVNDKSS
jgi:hypothetical protein